MWARFLSVVGVGLLAFGCKGGKGDASVPTSGSSNQAETPASGGPAVADIITPIDVSTNTTTEAALTQLTQIVRRYAFEHRRAPKSLEEVQAAGYISRWPSPPPGKKFFLEPKTLQVVLVRS